MISIPFFRSWKCCMSKSIIRIIFKCYSSCWIPLSMLFSKTLHRYKYNCYISFVFKDIKTFSHNTFLAKALSLSSWPFRSFTIRISLKHTKGIKLISFSYYHQRGNFYHIVPHNHYYHLLCFVMLSTGKQFYILLSTINYFHKLYDLQE